MYGPTTAGWSFAAASATLDTRQGTNAEVGSLSDDHRHPPRWHRPHREPRWRLHSLRPARQHQQHLQRINPRQSERYRRAVLETTPAGVYKKGTGTTTLAGSNIYNGYTDINGGILRVNTVSIAGISIASGNFTATGGSNLVTVGDPTALAQLRTGMTVANGNVFANGTTITAINGNQLTLSKRKAPSPAQRPTRRRYAALPATSASPPLSTPLSPPTTASSSTAAPSNSSALQHRYPAVSVGLPLINGTTDRNSSRDQP